MSLFATVVLGTANEVLSFVSLSLLLQLGFVNNYLTPIISRIHGEVPAAHAILGLQFVCAFYAVPALVSLFEAGPAKVVKDPTNPTQRPVAPPPPRGVSRLCSLQAAAQSLVVMNLGAAFLATVMKVSMPVRLELISIHMVGFVAFVIARLMGLEIVDHFAFSIARFCSLVLIGYAVVPAFDGSFSAVVKACASVCVRYINAVRGYAKI